MANSNEMYEYEALPDNDWIRLLRLLSGTAGLEGHLVPAQITGETPYEALIYTWGSTEKTGSLAIDGKLLPLTANCTSAEDHDEKGHEVSMMGDIYSRAMRTVVYLGPGDGTVHALRTARGLDQGAIPAQLNGKTDFEDARQRLLSRDWFQRKWIIQEVLLSQRLIVQCGKHEFSWRELEVLDRNNEVEIIRLAKKYFHPSSMSSAVINGQNWDPKAKAAWEEMFEQGEVVDRNAHAANVPRYSKYRAPGTGFLMPPQLFDILCATSDFGCKEPRDRVLAVLSLFARRLQIKTSYSCPEEEIYRSINEELFALGDTRMLWINDRVSWRPRWSSVLSSLAGFVKEHGEHSGKNRQATDIGRLWREVGQEGRIGIDLVVTPTMWKTQGVLLGTVTAISALPLEHHRTPPGAMSKGSGELNPPMWKDALKSLGLKPTECEDGLHPLAHIHQRNREALDWFREWTLDLFGRTTKISRQDTDTVTNLARAMSTHHGNLSFCKGMKLFTCSPGIGNHGHTLLGLAPQTIRADDSVFFLPCTSCPFVILHPTDTQWELVSLCWFGPLKLFPSCFGKNISMFEKQNWMALEII